MKMRLLAIGALLVAGAIHMPAAFAHPEENRVLFEKEDESSIQAGKIDLTFQLIDLKNRIVLTDKDLTLSHEKLLHFFAYDPALMEFRHEHPDFRDGKWHVTANLSVGGEYWIWAQGQIAADGEEFAASERLKVIGGTPANPTPPELGDVRVATDGLSKAALSGERIVAKAITMLNLTFSRTDGSQPVITPYLGAMAHVVGVPNDGDSLIHVHPMASGGNQLMLHMTFPAAGDYRLWVQFLDGGNLKTVPLSVTVFAQ